MQLLQVVYEVGRVLVHFSEKIDSSNLSTPLKQCSCKQHLQEFWEKQNLESKKPPYYCT